jgi:hypothetical protein
LILGLGSSAIGTLVERTTRFTMLLHLPRMAGHGEPRMNNGPALAGHGAQAVRDAIVASITTLPEQLRRSLTWDQGAELAQHARLGIDTGLQVFFCDPHARGSAARTRTPTGCCASTSPRAPTSASTVLTTSPPSLLPSTADPARPSTGKHPPKPSTSYCQTRQQQAVLRRPLEPKQHPAIRYTQRLADADAVTSVGSRGDSFDNALAETINGLYKTELIRRQGPWRTADQVELATLAWVDWFNHRRLLEPIGRVPPAEFEAAYHQREDPSRTVRLKHPSLR